MLNDLNRTERLRLLRFICSFAWADQEIRAEERAFVGRMVKRLGLSAEDTAEVQGWLELPPDPEDIDPSDIPRKHRQLFLDAARAVVGSDGVISPEERENLALFEALLR
jgi:tellurite resistance protein